MLHSFDRCVLRCHTCNTNISGNFQIVFRCKRDWFESFQVYLLLFKRLTQLMIETKTKRFLSCCMASRTDAFINSTHSINLAFCTIYYNAFDHSIKIISIGSTQINDVRTLLCELIGTSLYCDRSRDLSVLSCRLSDTANDTTDDTITSPRWLFYCLQVTQATSNGWRCTLTGARHRVTVA